MQRGVQSNSQQLLQTRLTSIDHNHNPGSAHVTCPGSMGHAPQPKLNPHSTSLPAKSSCASPLSTYFHSQEACLITALATANQGILRRRNELMKLQTWEYPQHQNANNSSSL